MTCAVKCVDAESRSGIYKEFLHDLLGGDETSNFEVASHEVYVAYLLSTCIVNSDS